MNALSDIARSLTYTGMWFHLGVNDFFSAFGRTYLGSLWSIIQPGAWILAICFFIGPFMGDDMGYYAAHVAVGLSVFNFISGCVVRCGNVFVRYKSLILNFPMPLFVHILRAVTENMCNFVAQFILIGGIFFYFEIPLTERALYAIPGVLLATVAWVGVSMTLSVVTAKWLDLHFALVALMRLVFFATPIIWFASNAQGIRKLLVDLNPIAQFIEVVRAPLLGEVASRYSWTFSAVFAAISLTIGITTFMYAKRRVPLWVQ